MEPTIDPEFSTFMSRLTDDEAAQLEANIVQDGCREPLASWQGLLLDGHHRLEICQRLGLPFAVVEVGLADRPAALLWIVRNQAGRRNLSIYERTQLALKAEPALKAEALERKAAGGRSAAPGRPKKPEKDVQISAHLSQAPKTRDVMAALAGTSHDTVMKVRVIEEQADEKTKAALDASEISINAGYKATIDTTKNAKPHVLRNSGKDNWYTPKIFIEAARKVMGRIDLDPASCVEANTVVGATMFYTQDNDGLSQPWSGKVWLNPPYGKGPIKPFCKALIDHMTDGTVDEAIVLVNNATETTWGQALLSKGNAVCFPAKRIQFCGPNDSGGTPVQGQMIVYFGSSGNSFTKVFSQFGTVLS